MPVFIALLRGINVGGNKTIQMARLKTVLEELGFENVKTHLNSGNVVFITKEKSAAKLTKTIEAAIEKEFGFRPTVVLRTVAELSKILAKNPFTEMAESDPSHLLVITLAGKPHADAKARLAKAYQGPEEIKIAGENVYLTYPNGIGRSKLTNMVLEKHLGVAGTARNWNTLAKLSEIAEAMASG
jgi:uncharacterized protein (DUF1697 family)